MFGGLIESLSWGSAPSSCRNSRTARTLFRVSVLCSAASSCRHRWFKPWAAASSCRNSKTARSLFRVSVLCSAASSSRYLGVNPADKIPYLGVNPAHKIPPRVVIVVQTPPRVTVVVPTPPRVAIVVSIQRIRSLIVRRAMVGAPPRVAIVVVRHTPRVAIVVQTGGETLGGKWLCVFLSIL